MRPKKWKQVQSFIHDPNNKTNPVVIKENWLIGEKIAAKKLLFYNNKCPIWWRRKKNWFQHSKLFFVLLFRSIGVFRGFTDASGLLIRENFFSRFGVAEDRALLHRLRQWVDRILKIFKNLLRLKLTFIEQSSIKKWVISFCLTLNK